MYLVAIDAKKLGDKWEVFTHGGNFNIKLMLWNTQNKWKKMVLGNY